MRFFLVFHICMTALVLVQCQEFSHVESDRPHFYTPMPNCLKEDFRKSMVDAVLKPRERHVVLKPEPGYEFNPPTVSVKRCNGRCTNGWSPMPVKKETKEFIVHLNTKGGKMSENKCVAVQVEEHKMCKCMCMKTKENCNDQQNWIPSSCACLCKNRVAQKPKCESQRGKVWNDDNCKCECADTIMDCESGRMWDREHCKCTDNKGYRGH